MAPRAQFSIRHWTDGLTTGVAFAVGAAVAIRMIPMEAFTDNSSRAGLMLLAILLGPVIVVTVRWLARTLSHPEREFLYIANTGAIIFDGVMTGFAPQFYGHQGEASHVVLAVIVVGLAGIFLADQLIRTKGESR